MKKLLTSKQRLFCLEYLIDLSATRAAIRAGYSKRSAASIGEENLRKPEIRLFLDKERAEREERTKVTADRVIQELAAIAFARFSDVATLESGRLNCRSDLTSGSNIAVSEVIEIETKSGVRRRVRFHDKLKALELLGRNLGMFQAKEPEAPLTDRHRELGRIRVALLRLRAEKSDHAVCRENFKTHGLA